MRRWQQLGRVVRRMRMIMRRAPNRPHPCRFKSLFALRDRFLLAHKMKEKGIETVSFCLLVSGSPHPLPPFLSARASETADLRGSLRRLELKDAAMDKSNGNDRGIPLPHPLPPPLPLSRLFYLLFFVSWVEKLADHTGGKVSAPLSDKRSPVLHRGEVNSSRCRAAWPVFCLYTEQLSEQCRTPWNWRSTRWVSNVSDEWLGDISS